MKSNAKRTLVKSAPELWELADDQERMGAWMAGVVGSGQPVSVEVTDREPERTLMWRAIGARGGDAWIAVELAEKGLGTSVSITAEHARPDRDGVHGVLERLLDELGSSGRRPFARG